MTEFLIGPTFFVVAITLVFLGVGFLAFLFRQGWIVVGCGFLALGLAIPGWLTVIGVAGMIGSGLTWWFWQRKNIGRSL